MNKLLILLIAAAVVSSGCDGRSAPRSPAKPAMAEAPSAPADPEPPKMTFRETMAQYPSLPEAIAAFKPLMSDETNDISHGAIAIGSWAAVQPVTFGDFQRLPKTKHSLVMKDADEERGKGICVNGTIIEIAAQKADDFKVYVGGLFTENGQIYRFIAARSTGDLVADSYATFCGVVVGRVDYSNSMGGTAHAIQLSGLFDLPQNRTADTGIAGQ